MRTLLALSFLSIAGCANLSSADCGSDAYSLGQRDGRLGATPQAQLYAANCGAPIDRAKYEAGWSDGYAQRPLPTGG